MSSNRQYTEEFKSEAVKQVVERGFTVVAVATRIGIPRHTLQLAGCKARDRLLARPLAGQQLRPAIRLKCVGSRQSSNGSPKSATS